MPCLAGLGGESVLGSGAAGDGGSIFDDELPRNLLGYNVESATAGELGGGGAGETPGALNPDLLQFSRFAGAPGGGGRLAGYAGDPARANPSLFPRLKGGAGGARRNDATITILRAGSGSGGGGGGATLVRAGSDISLLDTPPFQGAGGGSGGGGVHIVADGNVVLGPEGSIQANGGAGGDSDQRSGPGGGGGGGGAILIRATGNISCPCGGLQFQGGPAGRASQTDRAPFAADGGVGWARPESNGAVDTGCPPFVPFETHLTETLDADDTSMEVEVTQGIPAIGYIMIDGEIIRFGEVEETSISRLRRGELGTAASSHEVGAAVALLDLGFDRPSIGEFLVESVPSAAVSIPMRLGIGPAQAVFTHDLEIVDAEIVSAPEHVAAGTRTTLLWERAFESVDEHAGVGEFLPALENVRLGRAADFYRFRAVLNANAGTGAIPSVDAVRLRYRMPR